MMGDRERCIQAQMDEYLSKPLQQNHLIQTILKCATLGGVLLEKNRERELQQHSEQTSGNKSTQSGLLRPSLEHRAITTNEPMMGGMPSPSLLVAGQDDPIQRARSTLRPTLSEPNVRHD
jgi:osomolarity two-component system sensor histidine kinase NIK1